MRRANACTVSGCGDVLAKTEQEAIQFARRYFSYFPQSASEHSRRLGARPPADAPRSIDELLPTDQNKPFDMRELLTSLVDADSLTEIKALYAPEILTVLARLGGITVGIIANQPKVKGGVLFVESAEKAARFIWLCDAFNLPLLYLADVPGFMIGTKVERAGIIRAGANMLHAVS